MNAKWPVVAIFLLASFTTRSETVLHEDVDCAKTDCAVYDRAVAAYRQGRSSEASALFLRACDKGDFRGCYGQGLILFESDGGSESKKKANRYFERACDKDHRNACHYLAVAYHEGLGTSVNLSLIHI